MNFNHLRNIEGIELNKDWQPVVRHGFLRFLEFSPLLVSLAVFLTAIPLGLKLPLLKSPLFNFLSFPLGFLVALASWIVAYPVLGLLFGKFSFVNSIFWRLFDIASVFKRNVAGTACERAWEN